MFSKIFNIFVLFQLASDSLVFGKVLDIPLEKTISQLADKLNTFQVLKPVNFTPPHSWAKKAGLFESDIRVNFAGNPLNQELRDSTLFSVFDNDMFSTGWIITAILEADLYGKGAPSFDAGRLQLELDTLNDYKNKDDLNLNQTLVRTFWPQTLNATSGEWFQEPINIRNVVNIAQNLLNDVPFAEIEKVLKKLNLTKLLDLIKQLDNPGVFSLLLDAFCIPPDFDDTYLNLGIGATLSQVADKYPKAYGSWLSGNSDVDGLIKLTTRYAYRPFDSDLNRNTIDPRTYFYARNFIQEAFDNQASLGLITTW